MAEQREVIIKIKNETGTSLKEESTKVAQGEIDSAMAREISEISVASNQFFNNVISSTKEVVWYLVDRHFNLTDDYIGQRNMNIAKGIVSNVARDASMLAMAYATNIYAGIAMTIGLGVSKTIGYFETIDQQNIEMRKLEAQLSFSRERAGYSLSQGSRNTNL